jgi:hypothetical protein
VLAITVLTHGFTIDLHMVDAVGLGTLLLATATSVLAWKTRALAKEAKEDRKVALRQVATAQEALSESREQTKVARQTLGAQIRPVLIDVPLDLAAQGPIFHEGRDEPVAAQRGTVHVEISEAGASISVPMRNAGAGLAMIRGVGLRTGEPMPSPPVTIRPANVPPGEDSRVSFAVPADHPALATIQQTIVPLPDNNFSVEVAYSDLAGEQMTVTRFDVYFRSGSWVVRQIHFSEPGADKPFAGSAPVA